MGKFKQNFKYYFIAMLVVICFFVWYMVLAETRNGIKVAFLDVGQGDAIFIEALNGNQVLIDGGQNKKVLSELSKIMPFYDHSIDLVIESHPDGDHIGGLVDILSRYNISAVIESGVNSDSPIYESLENIRGEKEIPKYLARRGMRIDLGDGAVMEILFPDRDALGWDTNDASIIAKLIYKKNSFLFTGDSPQKMEEYLVSLSPEDIDVDVLKLGHHGSRTSSAESFLGYTSPQYAVISVGMDNSYGHPHKETLDKLNKFDILALRTDEKGIIIFESDGENISIEYE